MATEKDFLVKSSVVAPTSLQVGSATITSDGSAVILPANSVIDDGAGGTVNLGSIDLTGYATESYVTTALTSYATITQLNTKANTSSLATVALTGNYNDLSNKPSLASYATQTYVDNAVAAIPTELLVTKRDTTTAAIAIANGTLDILNRSGSTISVTVS